MISIGDVVNQARNDRERAQRRCANISPAPERKRARPLLRRAPPATISRSSRAAWACCGGVTPCLSAMSRRAAVDQRANGRDVTRAAIAGTASISAVQPRLLT